MNLFAMDLDNRELSLIIWGIVAFILMLFKKELRHSIFEIIKTLLSANIIATTTFMFVYVAIMIYGLHLLNFIGASQIKGTILWLLLVALPTFFHANKANQEKEYFKKYAKNNFRVILVLEFLTNLYVFNLFIELMIIPIGVFLGVMSAVAETKKEFSKVNVIINYLFGILGIVTIIYVIYNIFNDFESFANYENLKSFLLPIILSLFFIPAIYLQALFMNLESTFMRLNFLCENKKVKNYAKWKIFFFCHLSLAKSKIISTEVTKLDFSNKKEFKYSLNKINEL